MCFLSAGGELCPVPCALHVQVPCAAELEGREERALLAESPAEPSTDGREIFCSEIDGMLRGMWCFFT